MNYKKVVGFGVLGWLIMFAVVCAVLGLYNQYLLMRLAMVVLSGVVAFVLARYLKLHDYKSALTCSLLWLAIGVALDALITMQFNGAIFTSKTLWLGYAFMVVAPFLTVRRTAEPVKPASPAV